jgi:mono-ADP-ribosyltransferase sirtuin 6
LLTIPLLSPNLTTHQSIYSKQSNVNLEMEIQAKYEQAPRFFSQGTSKSDRLKNRCLWKPRKFRLGRFGGWMSASYAEKLQQNVWKGKCGDPEREESKDSIATKAAAIADLIKSSKHVIVHTGAGVSTSAGIPDFRGPNGVWTLQAKGKKPTASIGFADAKPTLSHNAVAALVSHGFVKHVVTQNIDGLHRRTGIPEECLSEIHGSAFIEDCDDCGKVVVRTEEVPTIGLELTGTKCPECGGPMRDRLCDWDSPLPAEELARADEEHKKADLCIVLGSSLRIRPAGNFPLKTKRVQKKVDKLTPGRIVLVNLQETHVDKQCSVRVFGRCDDVMRLVMKELGFEDEFLQKLEP